MVFDCLDYILRNHEKMVEWAYLYTNDDEVIDDAFEDTLVTFMNKNNRFRYDNEKPIYRAFERNVYKHFKKTKKRKLDVNEYFNYIQDCSLEELENQKRIEEFKKVSKAIKTYIEENHNQKVATKYKLYFEVFCEKVYQKKTKKEMSELYPGINLDEAFNRVYKIFKDFRFHYRRKKKQDE